MKKSLIYLTLASFGYAAMIVPTKLLNEVHSFFLVWTAFLITGILGLIISYRNGFRYSKVSKSSKKYLFKFAIAHSICSICLNLAVKILNASTALLLLYTAPLWIFLYLSIVKKHKIQFQEIAILSAAMIGMFFVVNGDASITVEGNILGLFLALTAGMLYSVDFLMGEKRPKELSSLETTSIIHTIGSVILLPGIIWFPFEAGLSEWLLILTFDLMLLGSFLFFLRGVKDVNSLYASIITLMEPVFAAVIAFYVLKEQMSISSLLGGAILLTAIYFVDNIVIKLQAENNS